MENAGLVQNNRFATLEKNASLLSRITSGLPASGDPLRVRLLPEASHPAIAG
jgi:hypothetical protein